MLPSGSTPTPTGWVRLYPINYRDLATDDHFAKYDIVSVDAKPARQDQRRESWKPIIDTMVREAHLPPWQKRRQLLDPHIEDSMCRLNRQVRDQPNAPSLALIRPARIDDLVVTPGRPWSPSEQRKIDTYVNQFDLLNDRKRTPLEAPRFKATYHYRCDDPQCKGHQQGVLDWELVGVPAQTT
ncbi:hypothetical protein ACFP2T_01115 [Plantactinospora solaniradicis]|uniref:Uncharacterized protein n=1 Tax=Plantactinospora solaniradicis TaxID=1723736 RepID=A0ABW1JZT9_9ACTN